MTEHRPLNAPASRCERCLPILGTCTRPPRRQYLACPWDNSANRELFGPLLEPSPRGRIVELLRGQHTRENPDRNPTVDWIDELRPYSATNNRFNPRRTKPDGRRWRCRSPGGGPREHAKHYWPGRSIRPHAADWLYDNSIWGNARQQGRVAARGCDHPIRRNYDEQYTSDRSYPAAVYDIRECWWGAGFSDGHNDWNGIHPAIRLHICEQFATDNSDDYRLAHQSAGAGSGQGHRDRRRDAHLARLPDRMKKYGL